MTKSEKLKRLEEKMRKDTDLPLQKQANNLVFGVGDPETDMLFIGEGPGYWEDKKAEPFVGRAGAFLNQMLQLIKLPREDVYITNVVHYRPPENRDPTPQELRSFKPYLDSIIDIIDPKVIVTLGRFSMGKFMPGVKISGVHGKPKEITWKDKKKLVIPMYHPAAGLRNPVVKLKTIEDFKKLPEILREYDNIVNQAKEQKRKNTKSEQMSLV